MNNIKKLLCFCFCVCVGVMNFAQASEVISLDAQPLGKDVVFIFYRHENQIIQLSSKGKMVSATINIPSGLKLSAGSKFNEYASKLKLSDNKQIITFEVKDGLEYASIINGEKLDAIKFQATTKKLETKDLSSIGSANNDPGSIKYEQKGDEHKLNFYLNSDKTSAAVFFRGKYMWVVFDQKKNFSFKNAGIFTDFSLVPGSDGTVLRFKVKNKYKNAKLLKNTDGWVVSLSKKPYSNTDNKNILKIEHLQAADKDGVVVRGNFETNNVISFNDPDVGDTIKVVPVQNVGTKILKRNDSPEFSVLKSVQGLVVAVYGDDVKIEKLPSEVKITSDSVLLETHEVVNNFGPTLEEYLKLPTILPYLDKNLDILDFNEQRAYLVKEASFAEDANAQFLKNLDLARFYFINGLYSESLDVLNLAKAFAPELYENHLQARFLTAVNYTLIDDYSSAKEEYEALLKYDNVKQIAEINLWKKYNDFSLGLNPGYIGFIENSSKFINYYSDDKYWQLFFAEVELGLLSNDLKKVERLLKEKRDTEIGSKYANSVKFYQAEYYRKKGQYNLAKQYYQELASIDGDAFNSTRAEFNLVKLQVNDGDIQLSEAIDRLESLRFSWRGDQLEYEVLMQLASYYKDNGDIMNALRTYQYVQGAFNNKISNFYITSEMAKIFNEVFLTGGLSEKMDDFKVVALFYEFKELNPIGTQGDDVIISIAKRLVRLDLLENAADLLRHQIKFRLHGEKKIKNADNLAIILLMDKKPNEAMLVLDDTDPDNFSFKEYQYRKRIRARALVDVERYSEAMSYLKDDDSTDAEIIRREILFQSKNWSGYIDRINDDFDQIIAKLDEPSNVQDILRLAISYYMLNTQEPLLQLLKTIGNKNQSLKDTIELLITSSKPVDYRNLDKSLNINQMKNLLDKYKNQFLGD